MPSSKPLHRFADIVENIQSIETYVAGLDRDAFISNALVTDAVERCLGRISEAAVKLDNEAALLVPDQPWASIRGLGNHLRHGYDTIRRSEIWAIVSADLPPLRKACESVLLRENFER